MFDNHIKSFEAIQKELLFLLVPALLLALSAYIFQSYTQPRMVAVKTQKSITLQEEKLTSQKEKLLIAVDSLLALELPTDTTVKKRETISKNDAMALLFSEAKAAAISINRSTPQVSGNNFSINLDFNCSFKQIVSYLRGLQNWKETLTVDKISLHSDRGALRCSMQVRFFSVGVSK